MPKHLRESAILVLLTLYYLCHLPAQTSANHGAPKFAPDPGKKLLIIGQDLGSVGGLKKHLNGYINHISGPMPAGVTTYTDLKYLAGLEHLANWGAGDIHAQAYVEDADFDQSCIAIGLYLVDILSGVIDGRYDYNIERLGTWIRGLDRPVFLRIGYEMEGSWNRYEPSAYVEAWRYIVHKFDSLGISNVAYVWQSAGLNDENLLDWYPGDEYVNWMGYSQFDGHGMGLVIRSLAKEKNKPVMISEATPKIKLRQRSKGNDWLWYERVLSELYADDQIYALAYINAAWDQQAMWKGQKWGDSRIQMSPLIQSRWEQEMSKPIWLHASDSLFRQLGFEIDD